MKARIRVQENGMDKNSIVFYDIIEYLFVIRGQVNIGRFYLFCRSAYSNLSQTTLYVFQKRIALKVSYKRNAFTLQ